jgi:hypothetical protein
MPIGALTWVAHMFVLTQVNVGNGATQQTRTHLGGAHVRVKVNVGNGATQQTRTHLGGAHVRVEVNVGNGATQQTRTHLGGAHTNHLGGAHVRVEVNVGNGAAQQKAFCQMPVRRHWAPPKWQHATTSAACDVCFKFGFVLLLRMRVLSLWISTLSPSTVVVSYHPPLTSSFFRMELRCSMLVFSLTFVIPFRVRISFPPVYWGGLCSSPWGDTLLPALIGEVTCAHRRG